MRRQPMSPRVQLWFRGWLGRGHRLPDGHQVTLAFLKKKFVLKLGGRSSRWPAGWRRREEMSGSIEKCMNAVIDRGEIGRVKRKILYFVDSSPRLGPQNTLTASLQRGKPPTINECPRYDNKRPDGEASILDLWEMWSTYSLPLLPGPLWPRIVSTC